MINLQDGIDMQTVRCLCFPNMTITYENSFHSTWVFTRKRSEVK